MTRRFRRGTRIVASRGARAVVVDLRRNTGGSGVIGPFPGAPWGTRTNDAYYRALGSFVRSALERALPAEDSALVDLAVELSTRR